MGERRTGVLLLQLGTPAAPSPTAVRGYLREFLGDPRVLDLPAPGRWLLLHAVILPFRPRRSAEAYQAIWQPEGSPLLLHTRALAEALGKRLGDRFVVEPGMRYGEPAIARALERLMGSDAGRILAIPLFPQWAASSTGSALAALHRAVAGRWNVPPLTTDDDFFDDPGFVRSVAAVARPELEAFRPDHVLFSYHGLPERQIRKSDETGRHCLVRDDCCDAMGPANRFCYRAQCFATSRALVRELALAEEAHSTAFQSRRGRTPWIRPFTDELLEALPRRGVRRLAVLCPSFVADCLETLEEIGIRGREQWQAAGGEALHLVPCVNAAPAFVDALAARVERLAGATG